MSWKGEPGQPGPKVNWIYELNLMFLHASMARYCITLNEVLDKLAKEKSLKAGDTVRLRSGGPLMTVVEAGEPVRCAWFQGKENREGSFPAAAIDREEPPCVSAGER